MSNQLKKNAISLPGAIAMSIAIMAPASGMMFVPQVVAQSAGSSVPLVYIIALIGSIFVANTIVQFSRRISHAGSFFAYNSAGLGQTVGFLSGWLLLSGYFVFYPQNILVASFFSSRVLTEHLGINIHWGVFSILFILIIWYLSTRGISSSMKADLYFVGAEMFIILLVVLAIIFQGGAEGNTFDVLTIKGSPTGWSGIFFGMIFAMMTFIGFESAATVAEETANPKKNIPRAIWGSVIGMGLFYILVTYGMAIGFGPNNGEKFAQSVLALNYLAETYVGDWLRIAVDLAGIVSAFAISLALNNATVRVIYAMGRENVLPKKLGKTHERFSTPIHAINAVGIFATLIALTIGFIFGPYPVGYGVLGSFATLPILLLYVLASVSLMCFVRKNHPLEFSWWSHGIAPLIGALLMLLPIYGSIFPIPPWPYNLILLLVFIYILVGIFIGLVLNRKTKSLLNNVGKAISSEES
ncbi:APC family permease [Metabacillus niabensis]|uniref:Amino acid transporter n=1 Tax=Metabacillus niabensis TaxID=324854 RepID=A0ABT9Z551_9BACI|nr:APC family permease [Metabacillus niabensis]MDQ0227342.1 amino acid transporter [Metabacillus niabensis]